MLSRRPSQSFVTSGVRVVSHVVQRLRHCLRKNLVELLLFLVRQFPSCHASPPLRLRTGTSVPATRNVSAIVDASHGTPAPSHSKKHALQLERNVRVIEFALLLLLRLRLLRRRVAAHEFDFLDYDFDL